MAQSFTPVERNESGSPSPGSSPGAIYTHPEEVASDPNLTPAEKRATLASWISDARAVENAPALRCLDSGALVHVDTISQVLRSLDEETPGMNIDRRGAVPHRRGVILKWLNRHKLGPGSNDNDDDPPPAPAGLCVPFHPTFLAAHGAPLKGARRLAFATA